VQKRLLFHRAKAQMGSTIKKTSELASFNLEEAIR